MTDAVAALNPPDRLRRMFRDPLLLSILVILWALLALFIVYPLASLLIRTFSEEGVRLRLNGSASPPCG